MTYKLSVEGTREFLKKVTDAFENTMFCGKTDRVQVADGLLWLHFELAQDLAVFASVLDNECE